VSFRNAPDPLSYNRFMKFRAAAKGRKLLFLAAVCLLPALLLSPTAEASRGLPAASAIDLEPPAPRWNAEEPTAPSFDLFHLEDEVLLEILTGIEPKDHRALLAHRRLELLPLSSWTSANQKTASGVSTSEFQLNIKERQALKPDLRWAVPFYAKARFYDPEVGRFLTEDPAEGDLTRPPSLHRYLYAYGNPTVWIDPLGRNVVDPRFKVDDRFPHYEFEDQIYAVNPLNGEVFKQLSTRYSALDPNDPDQAETIAVINSMTGASLPENYWRLQTMYEMAGHQLTEAEEKQAQREIASAAVGFTPGLETAQELAIFATGQDPVTGQYVGAGEYVTNTIGMALPFVSLRGGKHLFKSGSKRVSRGKGRAVVIDENGGMPAVVRNIDTGNEYVIVPRRGTGTSPGDAPRPPRAAGGAREPPPALPAPRTAEELRQTPGLASGGSDLPIVEGKWFKGTQGSAAPIPQQIAKQLSGKRFENIRGFREAFWKAVSEDPKLSRGWTDENIREMAAGRAPWAPVDQRAGGHVKYILHHRTPISQGGGVYDLDNITIVTPRYHSEVLESKYHGGG